MADNIISFKDAVLQKQLQEKQVESSKRSEEKLDSVIVALNDQGEKHLKSAETTKTYEVKSLEMLGSIKKSLDSIGKAIESSLTLKPTTTSIDNEKSNIEAQARQESFEELTKQNKDNNDKLAGLLQQLVGQVAGMNQNLSKAGSGGGGGGGESGGPGLLGSLGDILSGRNVGGGLARGATRLGRLATVGIGRLTQGGIGGMLSRGASLIKGAGPLAVGAAGVMAAGNFINDIQTNAQQSEDIEKNVESGALTRNQGNVLQGESFGKTAGATGGAVLGGMLGSALGPMGTVAGAWLGSKVGSFAGGVVGKYGVKAYQGIKSMLGFGETPEQEKAKMSPDQRNMNELVNGQIDSEEFNRRQKLQVEGGPAPAPPTPPVTVGGAAGAITPTPSAEPGAAAGAAATAVKGPSAWDKMKSFGAGVAGGIGAAGKWTGEKISAGMDKAKAFGSGIANWFGEKTAPIKEAWQDRNIGVGEERSGGRGSAENLISSNQRLEEYEDSNLGSMRVQSEGITEEKSAFGKAWLGKLLAGKGTQTEQFLATGERSSTNLAGESKTDYSQSFGQRISGGWFGKDKYMIGEDEVDKDTYLKSKKIAEEGGDAFQIEKHVADYKAKQERDNQLAEENKSPYDAMGNYTGDYNATPTQEKSGPGFLSGVGDKVKGFFGGLFGKKKEEKLPDYNELSQDAKDYQAMRLQQQSLENMRGPAGSSTFVDVDPETKAKQEAFKAKMEEKGKTLSETERKAVERNVAPEVKVAKKEGDVKDLEAEFGDKKKTEKDVIDLAAKYGKKDRKEDLITPSMEAAERSGGDSLNTKSSEVADARETATTPKNQPSIVNAPSVVNNNNHTTQSIRSPFRNEDSTVNRYIGAAHA